MKCIIRWRSGVGVPPERLRQIRLDRLLRAAQNCRHYQNAGISVSWVGGPRNSNQVLAQLPRTRLREFLNDPSAFHTGGPAAVSRRLDCPFTRSGRVAILTPGFEETPDVQTFVYDRPEDLAAFRPDSIAATAPKLRRLAEDILTGKTKLPPLTTAVICLSNLVNGHVTSEDRELFWKAFGVPVFEQLRGFSRELLAWECDAHDGLHIDVSSAMFERTSQGELVLTCLNSPDYAILRLASELTARIENSVCACGDASPRLVGLRRYVDRSRDLRLVKSAFAAARQSSTL